MKDMHCKYRQYKNDEAVEVKGDTGVLIKPVNTQASIADYLLNLLFLMDSSFVTFYIY